MDAPRHGGAREGAGRPRGSSEPNEDRDDYNHWKSRSERAKALAAEIELEVTSGNLLPRSAIQAAAATALATFVQHCRGIGDTLERTLGLTPEVAEAISMQIDEALNVLADDMKKLSEQG